jgi:hypothetical protein
MKIRKNKKINSKYLVTVFIVILLFCFSVKNVLAIDKYWVGSGNVDNIANWSLFSGGTGGISIPTASDVVHFDSGSVNDATFNVNITTADFIVEPDYTGVISVNDGVTLTIGSSEALADPVITVSSSGTQIATTTMPANTNDLGGAFLLSVNTGVAIVDSIKLKQIGSLSDDEITAVSLFYSNQEDGSCSNIKPEEALSFGSNSLSLVENTVTFDEDYLILFSASSTCLYVQYDLVNYSTSTLGKSIDFEITNPSTDITTTNEVVINTTSKVNISGRTMVVSDNNVLNPNSEDTDMCVNDEITSILSLKVKDSEVPLVFYLQNCAVWKKQSDSEDPVRLTNQNLKVHSLNFTQLTGANSAGTIRMDMEISNVDTGTDPNFLSVTRTYRTTATVKTWSGND